MLTQSRNKKVALLLFQYRIFVPTLMYLIVLMQLTQKYQLTMLFISHDLAVVRYICDNVAVMKQGKLVECGDTEDVFSNPEHPYTRTLLSSIPML